MLDWKPINGAREPLALWIPNKQKGLIVRRHIQLNLYDLTYPGVSGELIRSNVLPGVTGKDEKGVITHLDINVIDVTTCKPVTNAFVELWGCNSTVGYRSLL
jgi:protocatechuate 3,4-dioxygenase beta subunit